LGGKARFIRGFWDFWWFGVVFLWFGCGVLRGKDGFRMDAFWALEILQFFGFIFQQ